MPIGKNKPKSAEKLKTRRCLVRLKRMKIQTKMARNSSIKKAEQPTLKKRPVEAGSAFTKSSSATTSMKAKERLKTPVLKNVKATPQQKKVVNTPVAEELPPTIAAGRSRRIHKPNPKYASDDILTPKNIKATNRESAVKQTTTVMSLEDFFNKDSSDDELDFKSSKSIKLSGRSVVSKHKFSDSDFSEDIDDSDTSLTQNKNRTKNSKATVPISRRSSIAAVSNRTTMLNKTATTTKTNAPTQLQQLRRTLIANTVSPLAIGNRKRKLEENSPNKSHHIATKRFHLSTPLAKTTENNNMMTRRQLPNVATQSGQKTKTTTSVSTLKRENATVQQDKKQATPIDKKPLTNALARSSTLLNAKTTATSRTQQSRSNTPTRGNIGKLTTSTPNLTKTGIGKSTSTAATTASTKISASKLAENKAKASAAQKSAAAAKQNVDSTKESKKSDEKTTPIVIDDFETMPTFTIVNINDIINKKGDVLISESPVKTKNDKPTSSPTASKGAQQQQKQSKALVNKPLASKALSRKSSPERFKNTEQFSASTPLSKKPIEKVANSTLNKIMNRKSLSSTGTMATTRATTRSGSVASDKKPAPRILNSMVSRRTQPVKPVISNLDISSDDPSCSLSLYSDEDEDEHEAEEEEEDDGDDDDFMKDDSKFSASASESTGNESDFLERNKKSIPSKKSPIGKSKAKQPTTAAKENSASVVNNCLPKKQTLQAKLQTRNLSPEKVVVQREGNKIIKKITCFETWYVINIPPDAPEECERNSLDIPLIKLANSSKLLKLPSERWTTKVTLCEAKKSSVKGEFTLYTGELTDQNIKESDRDKYQPSCVMFRRTVSDRRLQLPYDRAVIFKNKTFFTNIEGKNIKLVGAPTDIKELNEVETLLQIIDDLTLKSDFVEPAAMII